MAELKLRVSLDTSYLKGQISRLPLEFAGANVSIRPKFDKQAIINEFRLLNRYVSSKKFNIVINTNLEAEIKNADRLIKALGRVQQAAGGAKGGLPIGTQVLSRTKAKGGFAAAEIKALFGAAVQGGLIDDKTLAATRAQMVAALGEIGKDSIAGLLNGLKSGDADIRAAAQMLGNNLITSFKTVLGIASPSKEFKKLGEAAGQGFEQGLLKSIEIAEQSATRKMQRMLDRLARMALIMSGISGPEIGRQIAQARALPSLNFGATTPRIPIGIGPSSTGRALPPGRAAAGMITGAQPPAGLLPGRASASSVLELNNILAGAIREYFKAVAREVALQSKTIGRTSISTTPLLSQSRIAGLLPGRPSPASTLELNNILAGAIREYFKSVAREIDYESSLVGKASIPTTPLLEQSRIAGLLPSRPSAASTLELNNILAGAIREYFKAVARELKGVGKAPLSKVPLLPPASRQNAPMLPPIGGTSGSIRISTGAYVGQPPVMRAPSVPPPTGGGGVPPTPPRGGGGGGSFGGMQFNVPQLPGAGLVREIGTEFGFAAKQVLLFGTAYKALAFIQGFPAQVGEAVGALQTFRNTIKEISPSAQEAAESSQFILDIVEKYNTPLQSARDGFVKLYASMQPAGFSGDEIRDLFLGISQTAATFGMSADKVDRVNYAFAQMASKGQVMSEELKGQLGDVLPGAMAIFAEAAGFKGPEAITKFSKALEDGAYKGGAMKVLLTNVGSIMRKEFGPGAEGAARTFQGVMNRMQNSAKLLYEAFEPVAVGFLNSVVMPLTSGLKTVTDGFNAFFTGVNTKTAGGFAFAQELEKLRPTFEGIRANVTALLPTLQSFANTLLNVSKVFLQIVGNPFVGYLARVYLNVLALTTAINILNLRALIPMIANFARSLYALVAFAVQCVSTGSVVQRLGMAVQVTGLMLRTFFATTGIGLVLVGIGLLTERFMSMNQALADTKAKALGASDAIRAMSQAEARQASQQYDRQAQSLKGLSKEIEDGKMKGKAWIEVTKEQAEALKSAGITVSDVRGSLQVQPMRIGGAYQKLEGLAAEAKFKVRGLDYQDKQIEQQADIAPVSPSADEDKKKTSLESYYSLQDQLAKNFTQAEIDRLESEHQHKIDLIKSEYDLKEARANSFQKEALRFERRMAEITLERQGALLKASNAVMAAQGSVAGGAAGGAASGGKGLGAGIAQYITGDPASPFYKADHGGGNYHDHLAFVSRQAAEEAYEKLTRAGIKVTEFKGRSRVGGHTPGSAHYKGLAFDVPGSQVPVGQERGLTARVQSVLGIGGGGAMAAGAGAARKVPSSEKRDIVADQKTQLEQVKQSTTARQAETKAIEDAKVALADFVATATPVEEQKLQNDLLKRRTELMMQGYSDSAVDQALKFAEAEYKVNFALKLNEELEKKGARTKAEAAAIRKQMTEGLTAYGSALEENTKRLRDNRLVQAMTTLKDRMSMAGAMTPDQELREQIRQRNPDFLPAEQESLFQQEKLVQSAEKLKADMQGIAGAIGDSFGNAFKGVITGSMTAQEALAGFFQSVADSFADMVAKMIAEYLKMALIKGIMSIIGGAAGSLGGGLSGAFGASGPSFNAGAFSGPALSSGAAFGGAGAGSFSGAFSGGAAAFNPAGFSISKFANGGIVTGPTLGLVGEGKYNEAVIPLPDGKNVPVQLSGGDGGNQINSNITVNVSNGQAQSNATGSNSSELGRKLEGAVKQVIVGELRPGGLLASR
jgi:tape measure domain-containing protein